MYNQNRVCIIKYLFEAFLLIFQNEKLDPLVQTFQDQSSVAEVIFVSFPFSGIVEGLNYMLFPCAIV